MRVDSGVNESKGGEVTGIEEIRSKLLIRGVGHDGDLQKIRKKILQILVLKVNFEHYRQIKLILYKRFHIHRVQIGVKMKPT